MFSPSPSCVRLEENANKEIERAQKKKKTGAKTKSTVPDPAEAEAEPSTEKGPENAETEAAPSTEKGPQSAQTEAAQSTKKGPSAEAEAAPSTEKGPESAETAEAMQSSQGEEARPKKKVKLQDVKEAEKKKNLALAAANLQRILACPGLDQSCRPAAAKDPGFKWADFNRQSHCLHWCTSVCLSVVVSMLPAF